jgi:hypothetical protein
VSNERGGDRRDAVNERGVDRRSVRGVVNGREWASSGGGCLVGGRSGVTLEANLFERRGGTRFGFNLAVANLDEETEARLTFNMRDRDEA